MMKKVDDDVVFKMQCGLVAGAHKQVSLILYYQCVCFE